MSKSIEINPDFTQVSNADCISLEENFAVVARDNYLSGEDHNESVTNIEPTIRNLR